MNIDIFKMHYVKNQEFLSDLFPIGIAIFEPTKEFDYYIISTIGLSQYYFPKGVQRAELNMVLPKTWKPILDKEEYMWPIELLTDIAYQIIDANYGANVGQVYIFNGDGEPYSKYSDAVGGIVCLPEMFPITILEAEIENSFTRFLQVMTLNKDQLSKVDELGPIEFIKYELHDSEDALMVIPIKEPAPTGIDKIIKKNENSLKGKK